MSDALNPQIFWTGAGMDMPDLPAIPDEQGANGAQGSEGGQGGSTPPREGAEGGTAPKRQTLREFLEANPDAKGELDREYVAPARTQAQMAAETSTRSRLEIDQLRGQQDSLTERLLNANRAEELASLRDQLREVRGRIASYMSAETTRQGREKEYARAAMRELYGLTDAQLDGMPQFDSAEALRAWVVQQSPVVQAEIRQAMQRAGSDQQASEAAQGAARFGQRLAQTPAPPTPGVGGQTRAPSRSFRDVEMAYIRGEVSFEDYHKARTSNPQLMTRI